MRGEPCACMMQAHALAYGRTLMPTYTHVQPRIRPLASTRAHLYAHTHPRTPRHKLMHAHACLHVRSRMPMTRPHTLVGSHATARALRIRTHGCPRTMAWAHYARERYAYARKRTGNHRASTFAHTSDLRPHYAPMSHAHTPMHAWGGGRQAHYAPSRNVVRGVTSMRRRGYALCVYGRNTMRDVMQLGVNGCKRVRLGTTWADASVCVWASGGVENPSWACMGAFGHTWTHTWVHTWVHEGQKFHFWDK